MKFLTLGDRLILTPVLTLATKALQLFASLTFLCGALGCENFMRCSIVFIGFINSSSLKLCVNLPVSMASYVNPVVA